MKIKRNEKYASIAFYAIITVLASAVIALVFFKFSAISQIFSKFMSVIAPITYGFVIAYLCNPLVKFFERHVFKFKKAKKDKTKARRALAIALTFIVVFAVIASFITLLIPQISSSYETLTNRTGDYISSVQKFADNAYKNITAFLDRHESLKEVVDLDAIMADFKQFTSNISGYLETVANYIISSIGNIFTQLKNLIIGIILAIYMLYSKEKLCAQLKKLLASITSRRIYLNVVSLTRFTDRAFGGFITGKILDSLIIGLVCFIVFGLCGFDYYPLMALVIAVTNIIPIFGPFIGGGILGIIILVVQPSKLLLFIILEIVIQQIDGNIVGPKILGESTGLSAMWVMIAIVVAGGIWGFPGMLLGVPAFAVIYSLIREISENRLKRRGAPHYTESYLEDPPEKDYLHSDIFIRKHEEIPENMMYPPDTPPAAVEERKTLWKKVGEKTKQATQTHTKKK